MQTIGEVAKILNITTQSIYNKINNTMQLELKEFVKEVQKGNRTVKVITEEGVEVIKESLESTISNVDARDNQVVGKELLELLQVNMDALTMQLDAKDLQIAELNKIIEGLQESNKNNQILLHRQQDQVKAIEENKSWWDKFKGNFK